MMKGENEVEHENVITDEEATVVDHTQALISRDEKKATAVPDLLELLGMGDSKNPIEPGLQYRIIVTDCLALSTFFQVMVALVCVLLGPIAVRLALMCSVYDLAGLIKHCIDRIPPKFLLPFYTGQCVLNTIVAGYGMLVMWSPSFCSEVTSYFSYEQCQNYLGYLQVMGTTVFIGHVLFQIHVLQISRKVYKHAEKYENTIKQTSPIKTKRSKPVQRRPR